MMQVYDDKWMTDGDRPHDPAPPVWWRDAFVWACLAVAAGCAWGVFG